MNQIADSLPSFGIGVLVLVWIGVVGLVIGSFLNVVIWRVPRDESVVRPASHCPGCDRPIETRDNIPVVSWLLLRGQCRHCKTRISPRYPAVELLTGVLFVGVTLRFGLRVALIAFLYFTAVAVALAFIDIDHHRLPNVLTLPSYGVLAALFAVDAGVTGEWGTFVRALIGMAALWTFYFVLCLIYPAGMGFGDVKLAGLLGLVLGWVGYGPLILGAFVGFLVGGVFGIALIASKKGGRKTAVPFGPFMLLGAFVGIFAGQPLADLYLGTLS